MDAGGPPDPTAARVGYRKRHPPPPRVRACCDSTNRADCSAIVNGWVSRLPWAFYGDDPAPTATDRPGVVRGSVRTRGLPGHYHLTAIRKMQRLYELYRLYGGR